MRICVVSNQGFLTDYPGGRTPNSDSFTNSFIMVVCEKNIFFSSVRLRLPNNDQNNILTENHYKTIYKPVKIGCSSVRYADPHKEHQSIYNFIQNLMDAL